MKFIEVEDDLYRYIASQTESIGEGASAILRRLLGLAPVGEIQVEPPLNADASAASTVVASKVSELRIATGITPLLRGLMELGWLPGLMSIPILTVGSWVNR